MKFTTLRADIPEARRTRRQFRACGEVVKGEFRCRVKATEPIRKQGAGHSAV